MLLRRSRDVLRFRCSVVIQFFHFLDRSNNALTADSCFTDGLGNNSDLLGYLINLRIDCSEVIAGYVDWWAMAVNASLDAANFIF